MKSRFQVAVIAGCALLLGSRFSMAGDGTFDNVYVGTSTQAGTVQLYGTQSILGTASTLGVGTSSPMARLGIVGRNTYYGQATFGDTNDAGFITFRRGGDGSPQASLGYTSSATENGIFDISSGGGSGAIRFDVAGVQGVMYLTTQGKLGLGTTAPAANFDICAGGTPATNNGSIFRVVDPYFPATASNSTQYALGQIQFSPIFGQTTVLSIGRRGASANGSSNMDGTVLGTLLFNGSGTDGGTFQKAAEISAIARRDNWANAGYANSDLAFLVNSNQDGATLTERMRIVSAGNVGIGTSNPQAKLDVVGGGKFTDLVNLYNGTGASSPSIVLDPINGQILLNGQSLLAPNSSGNIGIGTATPTAKVTIEGTTSGTTLQTTDSNGVQKFTVSDNGDISTGASTAAHLQITATGGSQALAEYYQGAANPRWAIGRDLLGGGMAGLGFGSDAISISASGSAIGEPSQKTLAFYTSDGTSLNERMRIDAGGNVGIGTTTPQAKVDINGDAKVSGAATISGAATMSGAVTMTGPVTIVKRQGDIIMGVYGNGNGD